MQRRKRERRVARSGETSQFTGDPRNTALELAINPTQSADAAAQGMCPQGRRGGCRPAPADLAIDELDLRLLRLLQRDGRMSIKSLADALGVAPATAHGRMHALARQSYILGYEAVVDPVRLKAGMLVFAEVHLESPSVAIHAAFKAAVQARHEVLECYEIAGAFDYLIKTRVADMGAYRDLIASVVRRLPGVCGVTNYAVMEEVKSTKRIPI